jgi:hypothetical protein
MGMKLVHIDRNPPEKLLRQFALVLPVFGLIVGAMLGWKLGLWEVGGALLALCLILGIVGRLSPRLLRPVFVGWMILVFPIHWFVSHTILVLIFYGIMTPIGQLMILLGRDPLNRKWDPAAKTYWQPHSPPPKSSRYFRQF